MAHITDAGRALSSRKRPKPSTPLFAAMDEGQSETATVTTPSFSRAMA
ncbi:MAG: hypothetical protein WDN06_18495 [Asticcacaulis sp.]